jgi:hypothetical protein
MDACIRHTEGSIKKKAFILHTRVREESEGVCLTEKEKYEEEGRGRREKGDGVQ